MCNPSPRGRCPKDASKAVASKIASYAKVAEDFYSKTEAEHIEECGEAGYQKKLEEVRGLIAEVDKAKVFMHATPKGQKDGIAVANELREMQKDLPARARLALGLNDSENRRAGKILSSFQTRAREYAKENPDKSNIETARFMARGSFINARGKMNIALAESYQSSLKATLRNSPVEQHGKIKAQMAAEHRANVAVLDKAYSYANEDAMDAVEKDRKKNSITYENSIDKHKYGFYKNGDGSFTVRTKFEVEAKNLGEAMERAENSFKLEDIEMTVGKPANGVYPITTSYLYKGGESLEDVQKFHKETWNGTPRWRETLAQAQQLQDFYDEENGQSRSYPRTRGYK
jgi:hypothetical protein